MPGVCKLCLFTTLSGHFELLCYLKYYLMYQVVEFLTELIMSLTFQVVVVIPLILTPLFNL